MSLATIATAASSVASIISAVTTAIKNGENIAEEIVEKIGVLGESYESLAGLIKSGLTEAEDSVKEAFNTFNDILGQVTTLLHQAGIMSDEKRNAIYAEYMAKAEELLKDTSLEEGDITQSTED